MGETRDKKIYYLAAISACLNFNSLIIQKLLMAVDNPEVIWKAEKGFLKERGIDDLVVEKFYARKKECDPERLWDRVERLGLEVISFESEGYPRMLREIVDFPIVLYLRGEVDPEDLFIGVVGCRKVSQYGVRVTEKIAQALVAAGITVVSGLALGVDGIAHRVAVGNKKKTVAVMACGLDKVYPGEHASLAKQILENGGALISEYVPGVMPLKHHFLARNRIIAGMGPGTVVIEAGERSGALATARCALDYNRSVYAVPGDIERPQAQGTNNLIKQGAMPIFTGEDVLYDLNILSEVKKINKLSIQLKDEESLIWEKLGSDPKHVDVLSREIGIDIAKVSGILMDMELRDLVQNAGGMCYIRK